MAVCMACFPSVAIWCTQRSRTESIRRPGQASRDRVVGRSNSSTASIMRQPAVVCADAVPVAGISFLSLLMIRAGFTTTKPDPQSLVNVDERAIDSAR